MGPGQHLTPPSAIKMASGGAYFSGGLRGKRRVTKDRQTQLTIPQSLLMPAEEVIQRKETITCVAILERRSSCFLR
jgi:hypothetical protein